MRGHADEQFVEDAREDENEDLGYGRGDAAADERRVDVAAHKVCYGLVPGSPVCADGCRVPPVAVELSVTEAHHLGQSIKSGLEEGKETTEPAEDANGGELHDALGNGCQVQGEDLIEGILEQRGGVLGGGNPDDNAETGELGQALEDKAPAYLIGPGIYGLVDKSRGPPKITEVLHVDILWVWTGLV